MAGPVRGAERKMVASCPVGDVKIVSLCWYFQLNTLTLKYSAYLKYEIYNDMFLFSLVFCLFVTSGL